jgi:hypothetical protein
MQALTRCLRPQVSAYFIYRMMVSLAPRQLLRRPAVFWCRVTNRSATRRQPSAGFQRCLLLRVNSTPACRLGATAEVRSDSESLCTPRDLVLSANFAISDASPVTPRPQGGDRASLWAYRIAATRRSMAEGRVPRQILPLERLPLTQPRPAARNLGCPSQSLAKSQMPSVDAGWVALPMLWRRHQRAHRNERAVHRHWIAARRGSLGWDDRGVSFGATIGG